MKRYQIFYSCVVLCVCLGLMAGPSVAQDSGEAKSKVEMMFWESVRDSNDIDMYRAYLEQYPNGNFAPIAKIKIKALSKNAPKTEPKNETGNASVSASSEAKSPKPSQQVTLRSKPEKLSQRDVKECIKKYDFRIKKRNPDGGFKNAIVDNGDGTVTDEATGLIWQKSSSGQRLDRIRAKRYVEKLNWQKFGGRSDWRLPTLEELLSLLKDEPQAPLWFHIDPVFHSADRFMADKVWTSDKKEPTYKCKQGGWIIHFWQGAVLEADWKHAQGLAMENDENYVKLVTSK